MQSLLGKGLMIKGITSSPASDAVHQLPQVHAVCQLATLNADLLWIEASRTYQCEFDLLEHRDCLLRGQIVPDLLLQHACLCIACDCKTGFAIELHIMPAQN